EHIRATGLKVIVRPRADSNVICVIDPTVMDRTHCKRGHDLAAVGTFYGGKCSECHRQRTRKYLYGSPMDPTSGSCFMDSLRAMDLVGNKHIPPAYLRAGFAQRLELLQGLMDTDGTIDKYGACSFSSS